MRSIEELIKGKVAVITGASRGIGKACVEAVCTAGVHDINKGEIGMRKGYKKNLSSLIAIALCATMTAGCTSESNTVQPTNNTPEKTSPVVVGPTKLPISEKPITITAWVAMDPKISATLTAFDQMDAYKELAKRTGITIKFIHPPIGQETQAFNLMIASDTLPDIIEYNWSGYPGGPQKAIDDNVIIPLNTLADSYSPNFKEFMKNNKTYAQQITTDSGKLYAFTEAYPNSLDGKPNIGRTVWGFQFRKDWLDQAGLSVPTTIDEWHTVLAAFKTQHPGAAPLTVRKTLDQYGLNTLMGAWGINYGFYNENGTVKFGPEQPAYKQYLTTMAGWYKEGLIDPNFALNDSTAVNAQVLSDKAGSWMGLLLGGMGSYLQTKQKSDPAFNIVGAPFPKLAANGTAYNFALKNEANIGTAITPKNKYAAETAKLMDYLFTTEGTTLMTYGIEGSTYNMVNGKPTYSDLVLKNPNGWSVDNAIAHYTRGSASSTLFVNEPSSYLQRMLFQQQKDAAGMWAQANASFLMPPVTPSATEAVTVSTSMASIQTYSDEMFVKFVMGQVPLSDFDSYIAAPVVIVSVLL